MKLFLFDFHGRFIGGSAVVISARKSSAKQMLVRRLKKEGLFEKNEKSGGVKVTGEFDVPGETSPRIHQFNNGDY